MFVTPNIASQRLVLLVFLEALILHPPNSKVVMAKEEQGIWMFIFPDMESTENLQKQLLISSYDFIQGIYVQDREIFKF